MKYHYTQWLSTYSIVARDPESGELGVAVQTHQMAVGRMVPSLRPGIGAVATQSLTNASFGPMALTMLGEGVPAPRVIEALVASDEGAAQRQVAVVDVQGRAAAFTGAGCIREAGHHTGAGYSVQANMMTRPTVIAAMANAYEGAAGDLAARLIAALRAAQAEDGDIRGMQSAALKIVPGDPQARTWETRYDLRVDEHENPVEELARLVRLRQAQLLDEAGLQALQSNDRDQALRLWKQAREQAPELEEIAVWQAVALADEPGDVQTAAAILRPVLVADPRRNQWIEMIRRLQECGIIERARAADELIAALDAE
jgi:uncharacterized Ntn-hydrolase superfamily protein